MPKSHLTLVRTPPPKVATIRRVSGRPEFAWRHLLLPFGLVLALVLRWRFGWGKGSTFAVAGTFVFASFAMGPLVARAKGRFDRALMRALQKGDRGALWPLYQRQWVLRALADRRYLATKRGLVHMELGELEAAEAAFATALADASEKERSLLETYRANALYALGRDDDAERAFRKLIADGDDNPQIYHHLAHGILRRGGKPREAMKLLEKGLETAGSGPVALPLRITLAEAFVAVSDSDRAKKLLREAATAAADGPLAARHALVEGKMLSASGEESAARAAFERARTLDPAGPTGREAAQLLDRAA